MKGGEKLTREWVLTCLFTQMLSTDAVPSLLLMSLPSPHPPHPRSPSSLVMQQCLQSVVPVGWEEPGEILWQQAPLLPVTMATVVVDLEGVE